MIEEEVPTVIRVHHGGEKIGIKCYRMEDIKAFLTPNEFDQFREWMAGQTGMIDDDGRFLVYKSDFERFKKGLPVID